MNLNYYLRTKLEVNKNEELLMFIESTLIEIIEYKTKLETLTKQTALDEHFINKKLFHNTCAYRSKIRDILENPWHILQGLADEDIKIERFSKSDNIYSVGSDILNIIAEYRKLTSFARGIYDQINKVGNFDECDSKTRLEEVKAMTLIFERAFVEYSSFTNSIDLSVKNFLDFSRKCIDIGENAK